MPDKKGLLIVNTGDGKGKSTAAFGTLLRAWGRGMKICVVQFDPIGFARFGCERDAAVQSLCVRKIGQQLASRITDLQHAVEASAESTGHEINGNESTRIGHKFVPVHLGQPAQAAGNGDGQRGEPLWARRPC